MFLGFLTVEKHRHNKNDQHKNHPRSNLRMLEIPIYVFSRTTTVMLPFLRRLFWVAFWNQSLNPLQTASVIVPKCVEKGG